MMSSMDHQVYVSISINLIARTLTYEVLFCHDELIICCHQLASDYADPICKTTQHQQRRVRTSADHTLIARDIEILWAVRYF